LKHVSVDAPFKLEEDSTLLDVLENTDSPGTDVRLIQESLRKEIERSLCGLSSREREVLTLFFGIGDNQPFTLEEIGMKFNLTRERVRQIKEKALRRLRGRNINVVLKAYLSD